MPHYLRKRHPGGTFFFTSRLADRNSTLLVDEIDHLRASTRLVLSRYPFRIEAIAVLPATIHTIWSLPAGDSNYSLRWSMLKSQFSRALPRQDPPSPRQLQQRARGVWQNRFWEHLIRDQADFERHLEMVHASPVIAGLCPTPQDWPHSSVHRHVSRHGPVRAGPGYGAPRRPHRDTGSRLTLLQ